MATTGGPNVRAMERRTGHGPDGARAPWARMAATGLVGIGQLSAFTSAAGASPAVPSAPAVPSRPADEGTAAAPPPCPHQIVGDVIVENGATATMFPDTFGTARRRFATWHDEPTNPNANSRLQLQIFLKQDQAWIDIFDAWFKFSAGPMSEPTSTDIGRVRITNQYSFSTPYHWQSCTKS